MRHRILLAASLLYLCAANIVWIAIDTRPPFWDMANHATWSLGVLRDFQQNGIGAFLTLPYDSSIYPPLYYVVTAAFYALLGPTIDAAQLANLPAVILLALATYGIARRLIEPGAATLAAVTVSFIPFLVWLSRETMLEYWLTAMVAMALWTLIESKDFSNSRWSIAFGICSGLGMLTKWTFVIFIALPAFWAARKNPRNAIMGLSIAAVIAAYWYVPQFSILPAFWRQNAAAAVVEQDPRAIPGTVIFYIRSFEGSVLFLPLFVLCIAGVFFVFRNGRPSFQKWAPLTFCILGCAFGLLMLPSTDPRYAVGVLPALSVFAAAPFEKRKTAQWVMAGFLVFQHVLVSFGIPQLPERVVLAKGPGGPIPFDWNLYSQTYFGLWGPPERQDWHIETVLRRVSAGAATPVRIGLVPDLPRLDIQAYRFAIALHDYPARIDRQVSPEEHSLLENDYLLISPGRQTAFGSQAPHAEEINAYVISHPDRFQLVDEFVLPSADTLRLYRQRKSRSD
ncbi:MAG TPA: glycosyltransferase family 39 protein [Terriglobia bacterium]|nr:glycosyltransferase family 39 protein [Terriglobia bacterium]